MEPNGANETKVTARGVTIDAKTGRWMKGTKSPNPDGRLPIAHEKHKRGIMMEVWSDDVFRALCKVVAKQALEGCRTSQDMMLRYSVPVASKLEISMQAEPLTDLTDDEIAALLEVANGRDTDTDAA